MARRLAAVPGLFAIAAEQYLPVAGAVDDAAERTLVVELLRRAACEARLIGDYVLVNALLATALPLIDPFDTATLAEVHTGRHAALFCLGRLEEADEVYRTVEGLCPAVLDRADATAVQVRGARPTGTVLRQHSGSAARRCVNSASSSRPRTGSQSSLTTSSAICTSGWTTPKPPTIWPGRTSPTPRCSPRPA